MVPIHRQHRLAGGADQPELDPHAVTPDASAADATPDGKADAAEIEALVGDWLTLPDVAERLRVPVTRVRQLVAEGELMAMRIGPRRVLAVPARFLVEGGVRPDLKGTLTVLADGGLTPAEALRWLFTSSSDFSAPGSPMDALEAGLKTQVRRQAQLLAC